MERTPFTAALPLTGLAACGTAGTVTSLAGSTGAPVPAAATWSVAVRGCEAPARCEELRSDIASRSVAVGAGSAERVVVPGQRADMDLDVQVTDPRAVPGAVRVLFGASAGRDPGAATGTARDLRGRTPVASRGFQIEAGSASHPSGGESDVADAHRRLAEGVVGAPRT